MSFTPESLLLFLGQYAYQPEMVYGCVILLMFASSFGFPVPEEVTLLSLGLIVYTSGHPEFLPPDGSGSRVEPVPAAIVAFLAVFISDLTVYLLGRKFGARLFESRLFAKFATPETSARIRKWTEKYGPFAAGIFRFTPGLRFPGHLSCGMMGVPLWRFVAVDGLAALLSVPTQVLLIAYYGDTVLAHIKQFKLSLLVLIVGIVALALFRRWRKGQPQLEMT